MGEWRAGLGLGRCLQFGNKLVLGRALGVGPRQLELEPVHFLLVLGKYVVVKEQFVGIQEVILWLAMGGVP